MSSVARKRLYSAQRLAEFAVVGVYAMGLTALWLRLFHGFIHGDEGVACMYGWRISEGEVPHRDFVEFFPPFSALPLALLFRLFGAGFVAERLLVLILAFLLMWACDRLLCRLTRNVWARATLLTYLGAFGVAHWPIPSHHWIIDILQILAVLVLLRALDSSRAGGWGAVAGALTALGFFTLQDQGAVLVVALLLFYFPWIVDGNRSVKIVLGWIGGGIAVTLAFAAYLLPRVSLSDLAWQWIVLPATRYRTVPGNEGGFRGLGLSHIGSQGWWESLRLFPEFAIPHTLWAVFLVVLPVLSLVILWIAIRNGWANRAEIGALTALVAAFLGGVFHRLAQINLVWAAPVLMIVLSWALGRTADDSLRPRLRTLSKAVAFALIVACMVYALGKSRLQDAEGVVDVIGPAGTVTVPRHSTQSSMQIAIDAIEAHVPRGAGLFCTGYNPMVNFFTLRPNPTRYNIWEYPYLHREEETSEVISLLEQSSDSYVLLFAPDRDSPLGRWVLQNYTLLWRSSFADLLGPPQG